MDPEAVQARLKRAADLSLEGNDGAARAIYEELANEGSWYAEVQLGCLTLFGKGGAKDINRAGQLFASAASKGSSLGKYYLALYYLEIKQKEAAFIAMVELSNQGYLPAINKLGWLYEFGEGCSRDYSAASHYRKYAAQHGHLLAKRWIAERYASGRDGMWKMPGGIILYIFLSIRIFLINLVAPTDIRIQG